MPRYSASAGTLVRLALFLFLLATLAGCGTASAPSELLPPGAAAPPLQAEGWIIGSPSAVNDLDGKVRVVTFWADWCGPCRAEAPHLAEAYKKYHDQGVAFLGFTAEGTNSLVKSEEFLNSAGITYPNGYGAGATLMAFQVEGIPAVFVIGRDGKIVWNNRLPGTVESAIEKALSG